MYGVLKIEDYIIRYCGYEDLYQKVSIQKGTLTKTLYFLDNPSYFIPDIKTVADAKLFFKYEDGCKLAVKRVFQVEKI